MGQSAQLLIERGADLAVRASSWKDDARRDRRVTPLGYALLFGGASRDKLTLCEARRLSSQLGQEAGPPRAAICNVGCANAMRMEFSANGPVNTPEFGTVTDPVEAKALFEMDGVQHVKPGVRYPALLGVAGWNDPRVAPWQPGKFIAAVQAASGSGKPVLLKALDNGFHREKLVTFFFAPTPARRRPGQPTP
jgi:hypothetical protein